jgi:hypothetical protein
LVLVVDDRLAVKPWLEGCWVLTFKPGTDQYFLLGFPVDVPVDRQYTIRDYDHAGQSLEDRSRFIEEALKITSQGGLTVRYRLFLDEPALAEFVDLIGGLPLDGAGPAVSGQGVVERYAALAGDPAQQLEFQRQVLEAITVVVKSESWTANAIQRLYERFQGLSPDADELRQLALQAESLDQATFTIQIIPPPR